MNLINELLLRFKFLQQDFIEINFNTSDIFSLIINLFLSSFIVFVIILIGRKIYTIFFKKNKHENNIRIFIYVALGYIGVGTGLAILGFFSLLSRSFFISYFIVILAFACFPISNTTKCLTEIKAILINYKNNFRKYRLINIGILLFVIVVFIKVIPPDTGVDGIGYHTDYPHLYVKYESIMIKPQGTTYAITVPQLGEMFYTITDFLGARESSRFLHAIFYLLVIFLILNISFNKTQDYTSLLAAILLVSSPIVIRIASTANTDFQWVFCWLLSIYIITRKRIINIKIITLAAVIFGGVLSTKIQSFVFLPIFLLYMCIANWKINKSRLLKQLSIFTVLSLSIATIWYLRAYILTGNPFYPNFAKDTGYILVAGILPISEYFSIDSFKFRIINIFSNLNPFAIFIFAIFILNPLKNIKNFNKNILIFSSILLIFYLLLPAFYYSGRYLIFGYSVTIFFLGYKLKIFIFRNKYFVFIFGVFYLFFFIYYFLGSISILPYGLGWADKQKYISRILSKDNSSYYDYDHLFSKFIGRKEAVATFGLWGFYYANFDHKEISYYFENGDRSLKQLSIHGINKLIIKGGDMDWLCKKIKINDCKKEQYGLISYYEPASQYMYTIK